MFDDNVGVPKNGSIDTQPLPPIEVPQSHWSAHPILSHGVLNAGGDGFDWPIATPDQLELLRDISVVHDGMDVVARLAPQFNFDRFVNTTFNEQQAVPPIGRIDDIQRFYTRVTDNGFHVVGVFTAITLAGRRRYFQWLTSTWVEIGQSGFLYVRDDSDTHFSEVGEFQLEQYQPGATTTAVPAPNETWSMEHFEAHFGSLAEDIGVVQDSESFVDALPIGAAHVVESEAALLPVRPAQAVGAHVAEAAGPAVDHDDGLIAPVTTIEPDPESPNMSIFAPRPSTLPAPAAEMISETVEPPVEITVTEIGGPPPIAAHRADISEVALSAAETVVEPVAEPNEEAEPPMNAAHTNTSTAGIPALSEAEAKTQQGIASALATIAHRGQLDRVGAAYIDHPARVAERFDWRNEPIHHAAAWLHSVMEDSDITQRDLLEAGIRPEIVDTVTLLTRNGDVSDGDFYAAINANPIARAVKLADVADNSAPWRVRRLDSATQTEFSAKYAAVRAALGAASGE